MISTATGKLLINALTQAPAANEIATALNASTAASKNIAGQVLGLAGAIIATSISTTVDFGTLKKGDITIHIPVNASAATIGFLTVATAGTLAAPAIVGDLYLILRSTNPQTPTTNFAL
jgi:hypothetical protein